MNINKALEHFNWRFRNGLKPTKKDLQAYNSIVDYKNIQDSKNISENESLAKLFIHQYMLLMNSEMYDSKRALEVINEILNLSVYEWVKKLNDSSIYFQLNNINRRYPNYLQAIKEGNITKLQKVNDKILAENENEIKEILKNKVSEEIIIKFVSSNISRIINTYEK